MILASLAATVVAVLLWLRPSPARGLSRRLAPAAATETPVEAPPRRTRWGWAAGWVLGLALVVGAHHAGGPGASAVVAALLVALATAVRLGLQLGRARVSTRAQRDVAHACGVLASQIRVGRVPGEALRSAAEDCAVLRTASRTAELGGDVTVVWRSWSRVPGHGGLLDLARAWQVSQQTGAPLARSLEQVSEALTADQALRTVVAGELSAPRATGKIMAVLPLCGLGMGYLLGGDPLHFLTSSRYGWVCLVAGTALAAAGVLWIDRLARAATEQG